MARLEELKPGVLVKGIVPGNLVTVIDVKWYGSIGVELTYKDASGRPSTELLYRDSQPLLEIASEGLPWSFDADGTVFRLTSEAYRIRLAYLFDPLLAVHTSLIEPLSAKLEVTLEISAELPDGAPESVVHTVTENCRTLHFDSSEFEEN